jgi:hypothetical protein
MNGIFSHKRLRWMSLGLVLAALAAPQAQARTGGQGVPRSAGTALKSDDRLGPKYVPGADSVPAGHPAPAITIVKPAGFDVGDALIGASAAAFATAAVAGLLVLGSRNARRRKVSRA